MLNCNDIHELSPLYHSGELDALRAAEFDAHVARCTTCADELRTDHELDRRLRNEVLLDEINTTILDQQIRQDVYAGSSKPISRWVGIAASIAAAIVIGALSYRAFVGPSNGTLYTDAAQDHRREVIDQQPRRWLSDAASIESLAERQGVLTSAVRGLSSKGYRLERGKLCRLEGRIFLHLVYSDGAREVSLFLRPHETGSPVGDTREGDRGREHVGYCANDRVTAVVVTGQSSDAAMGLARFVATAL